MTFFNLTPLNGNFLHPSLFFNTRTKEEKTPPLKDCKKKRASQIFLHTLRILLSETYMNENLSSKKKLYNRCHLPLYFFQKFHGLQCHFNGLAAILKKSLSGSWIFGDFLYVIKDTLYCPNQLKNLLLQFFGVRVLFVINTLAYIILNTIYQFFSLTSIPFDRS